MKINNLRLTNFRNHKNYEVEFSPKCNLIVGENGAGKTNILESIHVLSLGRSPRAIVEADLVNVSSPFARIVGMFDIDSSQIPLELAVQRKPDSTRVTKSYKVNNVNKTGAIFAGNSKSVMFAPEDIRLVAGSPSRRRDYVDAILSQSVSDYSRKVHKYSRVLKQRNHLLETQHDHLGVSPFSGTFHEQLEVWNENLLETGMYIQSQRTAFFEYLSRNIAALSSELYSNKFSLQIDYHPSVLNEEKLRQNLSRDILTGNTHIGPHRDDYSFLLINGGRLDLKNFGSRGQQRTAVFCLKYLEIGFIEETSKSKPILLIDDIFSELDQNYRRAIENLITKQQTIITSADINAIPESIKNISKIISL